MDRKKHQVFISYNYKDQMIATQVFNALGHSDIPAWLDIQQIAAGDRIADKITDALTSSDYFVLLISESSNASRWVKQELSLAFELSANKALTFVPLLLDNTPIPFELKGLLYIDLRSSVSDGISKLIEFFRCQFTKIAKLEPRTTILKADNDFVNQVLGCEAALRQFNIGDLRYHLYQKLSRQQVATIWFDLFHRTIDDEAPGGDLSLYLISLIDRARREGRIADLIAKICRSFPYVGK